MAAVGCPKSTASLIGETRHTETTTTKSIPKLYLIGERHSGTNWITSELERCFGHAVSVSIDFSRRKHWFQKNATFYEAENAVVVLQVRNVYDWVSSMWSYPHHAPNHFNLDWQSFVTRPWTQPGFPEPDEADLQFMKPHCVFNYWPTEVVPCHILIDRGVPIMYERNPRDGSVYGIHGTDPSTRASSTCAVTNF